MYGKQAKKFVIWNMEKKTTSLNPLKGFPRTASSDGYMIAW